MMQNAFALSVMLAIIAVCGTAQSPALAVEVVHFHSATLPSANAELNQAENTLEPKLGHPIWGHLGKPKGLGPFPAVILMHGCGGVQQSHMRWASVLNNAGYVTLVLDSFRPRSIIRLCTNVVGSASHAVRALDAYGALDYLESLPFVRANRVGLMGWSHGGVSVLAAVSKFGISSKFTVGFKTAITLYPYCISDRSFAVPTLILIGTADDWTPYSRCVELQQRNKGVGNPVELALYEGVFHGFDDADVGAGFFIPGAPGGKHWLQYDKAAHKDATRRVTIFLADHLVP